MNSAQSSLARIAPFAGTTVLAVALAAATGDIAGPQFVVAVLLFAAVFAAATLASADPIPRAGRVAGLLAFLVAAGLLRDAAGGSSGGVGILALLPLAWVALYGTRVELAIVLVAVGLFFAAPPLLIGGATYPSTGLKVAPLFIAAGATIGFAVQRLVDQVRARADTETQLATRFRTLASTDSLTQTGNRRAWDGWLDDALREPGPFAIALLDLDRFKDYNDERGHQRGDDLLAELARRWSAHLRPCDRLARYGGEEFALLLPGENAQAAAIVVGRLRALVPDHQTCSAGVADRRAQDTAATIVARADAALYRAKAAGRDDIQVADNRPAYPRTRTAKSFDAPVAYG